MPKLCPCCNCLPPADRASLPAATTQEEAAAPAGLFVRDIENKFYYPFLDFYTVVASLTMILMRRMQLTPYPDRDTTEISLGPSPESVILLLHREKKTKQKKRKKTPKTEPTFLLFFFLFFSFLFPYSTEIKIKFQSALPPRFCLWAGAAGWSPWLWRVRQEGRRQARHRPQRCGKPAVER